MFRLFVMETASATLLLTLLLGWILFLPFSISPTRNYWLLFCFGPLPILRRKRILICNLGLDHFWLNNEVFELPFLVLTPTLTANSDTHFYPDFQWQSYLVFADPDCSQYHSGRLIHKGFVRTIRPFPLKTCSLVNYIPFWNEMLIKLRQNHIESHIISFRLDKGLVHVFWFFPHCINENTDLYAAFLFVKFCRESK